MLLYEYQCEKCGHTFKKLFFICENVRFECPQCGDRQFKKQLDAISLSSDDKISFHPDRSEAVFS